MSNKKYLTIGLGNHLLRMPIELAARLDEIKLYEDAGKGFSPVNAELELNILSEKDFDSGQVVEGLQDDVSRIRNWWIESQNEIAELKNRLKELEGGDSGTVN